MEELQEISTACENYVNLPGIYRNVDSAINSNGSYEVTMNDLINASVIDEIPIILKIIKKWKMVK